MLRKSLYFWWQRSLELMNFYLRLTKRLDKVADRILTPGGKLNHAWHHPAGPKVLNGPRWAVSYLPNIFKCLEADALGGEAFFREKSSCLFHLLQILRNRKVFRVNE